MFLKYKLRFIDKISMKCDTFENLFVAQSNKAEDCDQNWKTVFGLILFYNISMQIKDRVSPAG